MMEEHWMKAWNEGHSQLSTDLDKVITRAISLLRWKKQCKTQMPILAIIENPSAGDEIQAGGLLNNKC